MCCSFLFTCFRFISAKVGIIEHIAGLNINEVGDGLPYGPGTTWVDNSAKY